MKMSDWEQSRATRIKVPWETQIDKTNHFNWREKQPSQNCGVCAVGVSFPLFCYLRNRESRRRRSSPHNVWSDINLSVLLHLTELSFDCGNAGRSWVFVYFLVAVDATLQRNKRSKREIAPCTTMQLHDMMGAWYWTSGLNGVIRHSIAGQSPANVVIQSLQASTVKAFKLMGFWARDPKAFMTCGWHTAQLNWTTPKLRDSMGSQLLHGRFNFQEHPGLSLEGPLESP